MDTQISRVLSQGLIDGDGPRLLARKLVATIDGTGMGELGITDTLGRYIPAKRRAEMIARTEVIRAHHLATIQEYRNWAVEGVRVKAEWKTAGLTDARTCDECKELEGHVFSLDEIEKMIPKHPNCRCVALPYLVKGIVVHGGPGSGHFGHKGRPGEVGGSAPEGEISQEILTEENAWKVGELINRDRRYSEMIHEKDEEDRRNITRFKNNEETFIIASGEDNEYKVSITSNDRMILIKKDISNYPVPTGKFMGFWESDHEKFFGVSRQEWSNMSYLQKASTEVKLQLKMRWAQKNFFSNFAQFYFPKQYDSWWWDKGGSDLAFTKGPDVGNIYWKDQLKNFKN